MGGEREAEKKLLHQWKHDVEYLECECNDDSAAYHNVVIAKYLPNAGS